MDTVAACHCDYRGPSLAGAGLQSRLSLRWDQADAPDQYYFAFLVRMLEPKLYDTASSKTIKPGKGTNVIVSNYPPFSTGYAVTLYLTW